MILRIALIILVGYFLGNIQWGLIISQRFGLNDIRSHGSGGTGATNVLRAVGPLASVLTLVCDSLKGALAGVVGGLLMGGENAVYGVMLGGVFAVVGHILPVLFGFRGGKGVAASFGAVMVVSPYIGIGAMVLWAGLILIMRFVSLASIMVAFGAAVAITVLKWGDFYYMAFGVALFFLILYCHRDNIKRLWAGQERTISFKRSL